MVTHERRQLRAHYDCPWVTTFRGLLTNVPPLDLDDRLSDPDPMCSEIDVADADSSNFRAPSPGAHE